VQSRVRAATPPTSGVCRKYNFRPFAAREKTKTSTLYPAFIDSFLAATWFTVISLLHPDADALAVE